MDRIIADIKSLRIQGAREIAKAGIEYIARTMKASRTLSKEGMQEQLLKEINRVIKVRPTEPMLVNSLARIAVEFGKADIKTATAMKRFIADICLRQREEMDQMLRKIAVNGATEIEDGDIIMTHCHSNDLMAVFAEARRNKKNFKVIVTETRPLYQGLKTAKELLEMGIPVVYCEDSAMAYMMKETAKTMVGCDAILPDGSIVNKIGTFLLALVAKEFGRPFLVVGETLKMTEQVEIEQRAAPEVIDPRKLPGAEVVNPAFDITPGDLVTAIITEKGKLVPGRDNAICSGLISDMEQ
jgi:ribose 1,5-bisphosphate isomerase